MRIAQIASVAFSVPPRAHGGTELVIDWLTRGLAARGHEVTLFASGDSRTCGRLHSVVPRATQDDPGATMYLEREYEVRNVAEAYERASEFDLLHAHYPTPAPYFSDRTERPTLLTCAWMEKPIFDYYRTAFPRLRYACVSRAQAGMLGADLPVILNGIPLDEVPFGDDPEDFCLTVGRLVPAKGADAAIRVARRAGRPLVIVGEVTPYLPESRRFYEEAIAPHIDGIAVRHVPRLAHAELLALMARAAALLFPISWEEPFGLVVAEAMAAGTPVIATRRGSLPELVEDGITGFLADSEDALVEACRRIPRIDRTACRARAERLFDARHMVDAYERLYAEIARETPGRGRT
jgi:glycosyltransferase involved in cell wall biosynthesis